MEQNFVYASSFTNIFLSHFFVSVGYVICVLFYKLGHGLNRQDFLVLKDGVKFFPLFC